MRRPKIYPSTYTFDHDECTLPSSTHSRKTNRSPQNCHQKPLPKMYQQFANVRFSGTDTKLKAGELLLRVPKLIPSLPTFWPRVQGTIDARSKSVINSIHSKWITALLLTPSISSYSASGNYLEVKCFRPQARNDGYVSWTSRNGIALRKSNPSQRHPGQYLRISSRNTFIERVSVISENAKARKKLTSS